jgi:hypothetical protein
MLRQYRWFDLQMERTKKGIPQPVQRLLKRVLKKRVGAGAARWNPDLLQWVQDQLADDNQQFLEAYGKPRDFWQAGKPTPVSSGQL